ncbi:MAG: hypothetical protein ACRDJN_02775 [Chloroflexota bacterium]
MDSLVDGVTAVAVLVAALNVDLQVGVPLGDAMQPRALAGRFLLAYVLLFWLRLGGEALRRWRRQAL